MPDTTGTQTDNTEGALPDIWVRAHPFGDARNKDDHGQYFDARTNFHDGVKSQMPVAYIHNWNTDGDYITPADPVSIGVTVDTIYANPQTGKSDGRWDRVHFFGKDKIPANAYNDLKTAIENNTLRSSPSVVPDFHRVERDGRISHWLPGSISVFGLGKNRKPINRHAIGITAMKAMKAMYQEAALEFPEAALEGIDMTTKPDADAAPTPKTIVTEFTEWLKAKLNLKDDADDDDSDDMTPEKKAIWAEFIGEDDETADDADKDESENETDKKDGDATPKQNDKEKFPMADKNDQAESDLRLEYEKQQTQLKAMRDENAVMATQIAEQRRRLDEKDMGAWFDEQLRAGKVMPAEREQIIGMALQAKADDAALTATTMKAANGSAATRLDAFKATIEARPSMLNFDPAQLKAAGFDGAGDTEKPASQAEKDRLLQMTDVGKAAIQHRANGKQ